MFNKIAIAGCALCLFAGPAMAAGNKSSKEENIGVGTGAVIGAVAGGPVGFIVGAAIGAKIGDKYGDKKAEAKALSANLSGSQQRVSALQTNVESLNQDIDQMGVELQQLRQVANPELIELMQAGIAMDLLFRTDEDVLVVDTNTRLQQLATSLATTSDIYVQLDGFADERGNAKYNQQLSVRRAEHVRDLLIEHGVSPDRIKLTAHGESPAADPNIDSFALERRVSLTLYVQNTPSFAANP